MRDDKPENLVIRYIFLAIGCGIVGVVISFVVIFVCQYYGIDIYKNLWVLAIPVTLSVLLNVFLLELFRRFKGR